MSTTTTTTTTTTKGKKKKKETRPTKTDRDRSTDRPTNRPTDRIYFKHEHDEQEKLSPTKKQKGCIVGKKAPRQRGTEKERLVPRLHHRLIFIDSFRARIHFSHSCSLRSRVRYFISCLDQNTSTPLAHSRLVAMPTTWWLPSKDLSHHLWLQPRILPLNCTGYCTSQSSSACSCLGSHLIC
jgi:hypothetical protein